MAARELAQTVSGVGRPFIIDCTPSWRTQAEWCLVGLEDGSPSAKEIARSEIRRMGDLIDKLLAERAI